MVSAALWERLRALDARCDFELARRDANDLTNSYTSRVNHDRQWRVVIRDRTNPESAVVGYGPSLAPLLEDVLRLAEQRGWDAAKGTAA